MFLGKDSQAVLLSGINKVANFVAATMGPGGKVINFSRGNNNYTTKDGVTVAKFFRVQDTFEQSGVDMIIEAAKRTVDAAGDGTTTTTVMSRSMMEEGYHRLSNKKLNTNLIARHMVKFSELAIKHIQAQSTAISDLEDPLLLQVGTISANGDTDMAKMCLEAIKAVKGKSSSIIIHEALYDDNDSVTVTKGLFIKSQVAAEMLGDYKVRSITPIAQEGRVAVFIVPSVNNEFVITNEHQSYFMEAAKNGHAVLLVASDPSKNTKSFFNNQSSRLPVVYGIPSFYGNKYVQLTSDLITMTDAREIKLQEGQLPFYLGYCDRVEMQGDQFILFGCLNEGKEAHHELVAKVTKMKAEETSINARDMLDERLARLGDGVATIRVTGGSVQDMLERKDRVDDAIRGMCTAIESGVSRGGGAAYLSAAYMLQNEEVDPLDQEKKIARDLIESALIAPFNTITSNALNYIPKVDGRKMVSNTNLTVDVWTGELIDAFEYGILDPLGVQVASIKSSVNVATLFLNVGGMYSGQNESW